ncbi:carbohydrate-binding module family 63 protein [Xylariaceae sp. FL1651]|nr:carbohydrate-binding module family 63 protein [Xylariaceae sp. FL1651]
MKTSSAVLAMLAVPYAMACPRRMSSGTNASTTASAASIATSIAQPTTASAITSVETSTAAATSVSTGALPVVPVAGSTAVTGKSTFYGGNLNGGTCSFSTYTLPSGIYGTAFSGSAWNSAANCGACLQVTSPTGNKITAMIVDQCPECDAGHLDLFPDAFKALDPTANGVMSTSYTFVDCPISSPLILHNKLGTSPYWFSMQVVNANEPVTKLEVSTNGGSTWQSTTRKDYNFFENPSGFGTSTVAVRVTSKSGSTVVVKNVSVASDSKVTAGSNF